MSYYSKSAKEIFDELSTGKTGLTRHEAASRMEKYGKNEIPTKKNFNVLKSFASQFADLLLIILIIAALISLLLGQKEDALLMIIIVILNALIGFFQEFKASRSIESLKNMISPSAKVLREGKEVLISSKDVVVGDILIIEEGDKIAADARIIEENDLRTDESALTGESLPQKKDSSVIMKADLMAADQKNMLFLGTNATHGNAKAVVVVTGKDTEFGKIANATASIKEEKSPLQKEIFHIGKLTAKATVILMLFVVVAGLIIGHDFLTIFLFAVSLAVAVVPEGLPTAMSVSLAVGVQRMAKQKAIIRKLSSVETLGSTTVICSDKTGTLTKNQMTARKIWADKKVIDITGVGYEPKGSFLEDGKEIVPQKLDSVHLILNIATLCNNAKLLPPNMKRQGWEILGDPTEGALIVAAEKVGFKHDTLSNEYVRIKEIPFDSEKKRMITVNKYKKENYAFMKGAPDEVLATCSKITIGGVEHDLSKKDKDDIISETKSLGNEALRVIGFAYKKVSKKFSEKDLEKDFIFVGLIGMLDPPRPEVADSIKQCREAGIRVNIITGDFGETAKAIAKQIGLADENTPVITGEELDKTDNTKLRDILRNECIFARVSPSQKLRIITSLQEMGEIVTVSGDGVNDAPALKKANIGVSMGICGTDVARESSDAVLADDSFSTIVSAVRQGRRIYDNIKRTVTYTYCAISAEVFIVFFSLILGFLIKLPLPLLALHILIINFGVEVFPSISMAFEPEARNVMKKKPRNPNYKIMNHKNFSRVVFLGFIMSMAALFLFIKTLRDGGWALGTEMDYDSIVYIKATTITLATIIVFQMFNAFSVKSRTESVFSLQTFKNKVLLLGVGSSLTLVILLTSIPALNNLLHTAPLGLTDWAWIIGLASSVVIVEEVRKFALRIKERDNPSAD